jgi:glycosyltransferase involved in cell wall biosynthesis
VLYGYFPPGRTAFYAFLERTAAWVTDRLVALTEGEKRESLAAGIGRPEKWSVIPSGVSWDDDIYERRRLFRFRVRQSLGLPENARVAGSVMRLEPVKGPAVLAAAAEILLKARPDLHFVFVGDGAERPAVEAVRGRLKDPSRLLIAGHRDDPFLLMTAMDVYVQPSLNEGMGKTLVMAQAMGLPVVASRVCGIPDVVREGETALLVPPDDPTALAAAMGSLFADEPLRERLGAAGRARVTTPGPDGTTPFGVDRMVRLLEALYAQVLPR